MRQSETWLGRAKPLGRAEPLRERGSWEVKARAFFPGRSQPGGPSAETRVLLAQDT